MRPDWRSMLLPILILASNTRKVSAQCVVKSERGIECSCAGNEEFVLPQNLDYSSIRRVLVTSCVTANLNFSNLADVRDMTEIFVHNISHRLTLGPLGNAPNLRTFELLRIKRITLIPHDAFAAVSSIEHFRVEDARIVNFEEQFGNTRVASLTLRNVTVDRMIGINFSEKGRSLRIHRCAIRNVQTSLNFAFFANIDVRNSEFELEKPGHVSIEGISAIVSDCVFTNVSMNLVASDSIAINGTCADGKSSLRLSANGIQSFDNRLPTEIVYTRNSAALLKSDHFFSLAVNNNTVCIAGNCKCPKSAGHNSYHRFHLNAYLGLLLFILVPGLF